jgi:uncharacterized membrane protein
MDTKHFLSRLDDDRIVEAIRQAESRSRGEIRVHVTSAAVGEPQAAAAETFVKLGMARTAERNGVLIFVSPRAQTFAIIGDTGVHTRFGGALWTEVAGAVAAHFRQGRFTEGVVEAVTRVGDVLAREFPRKPGEDDQNELPDQISRD